MRRAGVVEGLAVVTEFARQLIAHILDGTAVDLSMPPLEVWRVERPLLEGC